MTTLERIKILANKRGINLKELAGELGFSKNAFYKWKKSNPSTENIQKVADYFHVSVDYLLGRTNNPYLGMDERQRNLTIEESIRSAVSYNGKEVSENDKEVLARIVAAYLDGKL